MIESKQAHPVTFVICLCSSVAADFLVHRLNIDNNFSSCSDREQQYRGTRSLPLLEEGLWPRLLWAYPRLCNRKWLCLWKAIPSLIWLWCTSIYCLGLLVSAVQMQSRVPFWITKWCDVIWTGRCNQRYEPKFTWTSLEEVEVLRMGGC